MHNDEPGSVNLVFELEASEVHEFETEAMTAVSVGPDRYRLESSPFYAYGYSRGDIVEATLNDCGVPVVRRLVRPSGHSTYRVIIAKRRTSLATFEEYWELLAELGCGYKPLDECYLTIDVPAETDIEEACGILEEAESAGAWYFEEAHCGHCS